MRCFSPSVFVFFFLVGFVFHNRNRRITTSSHQPWRVLERMYYIPSARPPPLDTDWMGSKSYRRVGKHPLPLFFLSFFLRFLFSLFPLKEKKKKKKSKEQVFSGGCIPDITPALRTCRKRCWTSAIVTIVGEEASRNDGLLSDGPQFVPGASRIYSWQVDVYVCAHYHHRSVG